MGRGRGLSLYANFMRDGARLGIADLRLNRPQRIVPACLNPCSG